MDFNDTMFRSLLTLKKKKILAGLDLHGHICVCDGQVDLYRGKVSLKNNYSL